MSGDGLGIAARLAIGVLVSVVASIIAIETMRAFLLLVPFGMTALTVLWVVTGAARDDGGVRKAGIWTLLGVGVASACTTLFFVVAVGFIYVVLVHPPGP